MASNLMQEIMKRAKNMGKTGKKIMDMILDYGEAPKKDYTKWNENIKKGTPQNNLK